MDDCGSSQIRQAALPVAGIVLVSLYIAAQIISDVASLKIAFLFGLSIDAGTFIYPITFTLRDLVHKRLGKRAARLVIVLAGGINLFMAAFFAFSAWLPGDPSWGLAREFSSVLGPVWRIVTASIAAEIAAELVDTEVYHLWVTRITRRHQWARVLVSNAVSVPLDSLIFCWAAFGGALPVATVWSIVAANLIVKGAVTLLSIPGIYLVKERW
ncbi:MAG: queuosine precursor transporter [Spirochaetaceae bacterium]|nr:MAG: queuosine precursor transporter [Spirochaetaceae bacterium]